MLFFTLKWILGHILDWADTWRPRVQVLPYGSIFCPPGPQFIVIHNIRLIIIISVFAIMLLELLKWQTKYILSTPQGKKDYEIINPWKQN